MTSNRSVHQNRPARRTSLAVAVVGALLVAGCASSPEAPRSDGFLTYVRQALYGVRFDYTPVQQARTSRRVVQGTTTVAPTTAAPATLPPPTTAAVRTTAAPTTTVKPAPATTAAPPLGATSGRRDLFTWPFSATSIWNVGVGTGAVYTPAGMTGPAYVGADRVFIIKTTTADPYRPVFEDGAYFGGGRCNSRTPTKFTVRVPDNFYVPDANGGSTPNSMVTLIDPDGRTARSFGVVARCLRDANGREPGQAGYGAQPIDYSLFAVPGEDTWAGGSDLAGPGTYGAHGGSALSSMGGHIRAGELTGSQPIRHALAINIWARKYLAYDYSLPAEQELLRGRGYRWPAKRADAYAARSDGYHGSNNALVMGSLLAVPPSVSAASLGITTDAGRKLFDAMRDYGAYVVDDSYFDGIDIGMESSAVDEYQRVVGNRFGAGREGDDVRRIVSALAVVDNNSPSSIGGGGAARVPAPPAF